MPTETRSAKASASDSFADLLARSGAKERASIEKHLAACDAENDPAHGKLWRRIAGKLGGLSPLNVQTAGQHAVMFFIPDGKYRMQVFALEDQRDGLLLVYLPDVLDQAVKAKILTKPNAAGEYALPGARRQTLTVLAMDAQNTPEPPAHVKHMLGWNRKAVRVSLPTTDANSAQVAATEALCALAAKKWLEV